MPTLVPLIDGPLTPNAVNQVINATNNLILEVEAAGIGTGDVSGPASSTNGVLALFSGTTGKLLAAGAAPPSGTNTGDQNLFRTIAVAGQSDVVADTTTDTLTLAAGSNITITTDAGTDTVTIAAAGGSVTVSAMQTVLQDATDTQATPTGTDRATAYTITKTYNVCNTPSAAEGVVLPAGVNGAAHHILAVNGAANMHVYASGSDTITVTAGANTGVHAGATGTTFGSASEWHIGVFTFNTGTWTYTGFAGVNVVTSADMLSYILLNNTVNAAGNDPVS